MIMFVNFEKAFDEVEWPSMFKILKAFNFGSNYRFNPNMLHKYKAQTLNRNRRPTCYVSICATAAAVASSDNEIPLPISSLSSYID